MSLLKYVNFLVEQISGALPHVMRLKNKVISNPKLL